MLTVERQLERDILLTAKLPKSIQIRANIIEQRIYLSVSEDSKCEPSIRDLLQFTGPPQMVLSNTDNGRKTFAKDHILSISRESAPNCYVLLSGGDDA